MRRVRVREEAPADREAVFRVESAAFGRSDEALLVDALRGAVHPFLSLVAEEAGAVVGHVALSPVRIDPAPPQPPSCAGLAPLAVVPERQGRGIGAALVREGLARCPGLGWRAVFLLGDPGYYARFGFSLAAPRGLRYESEAFDRGFQVLELEAGALAGCRGFVRYAEAFGGSR